MNAMVGAAVSTKQQTPKTALTNPCEARKALNNTSPAAARKVALGVRTHSAKYTSMQITSAMIGLFFINYSSSPSPLQLQLNLDSLTVIRNLGIWL